MIDRAAIAPAGVPGSEPSSPSPALEARAAGPDQTAESRSWAVNDAWLGSTASTRATFSPSRFASSASRYLASMLPS